MQTLTIQVKVGCKDPTYEIIGNDKITCQRNKTWTPHPFPECERKTCGQELYLTKDGQCKACPDGDFLKLHRRRTEYCAI